MSFLAVNPILKAIKAALAQPTEANIFALADAANLTIKKESLKIEVVEHTTKKGKVIRGVVRTDLSYAEAKAIDEFTFKKEGGWFIREKHLSNEPVLANNDAPTDNHAQSTVIESVQTDSLVSDAENNIEGLVRKFKPADKKYKNPQIRLEPKEGAKLLKQTLTKLFPNTKFKVNMSRGTAYGSVSVSWVDGASYNLVDVIARHFKGSGFDGMSDSSYYLNAINEDGKVVDYGLGYVSISRSYSREFLERLKDAQTLNMDNVNVESEGDQAWFSVTGREEDFVSAVLNKAKLKNSTGKYSFGVVPQAENNADIEPSNEQPKSGQVQNSHQELADTLKMLGWKIEPLNNQEGDIFASKDMEVKYKDKLIKAKATLRKWLENKSLLTAYADELVLKNDHKATIDTSQFWKLSPVEQKQIIIDLETALRSFLIANRERFSQADSQSPQVVTTQEPQPKTNQMPSLMQYATGLDPAIKDMVKEYYDLVHGTYVDEKLADPTLENWERKEYLAVKADNDKRRNELEQHLNNVVSANGIDWKTHYNELVRTNKKEANNVPSTSNAMESDSDNTIGTNQKQSAENGNANESGEPGRLARPPVNGLDARGGSERDSGLSLPKNDGIGIGARGDTSVSDGAGERGVGAGNTATKSSGSSRTNESRTPTNRKRDSAIVRTSTRVGSVTQTAKEAEQLKAEGTPTQWGNAANIDKALPYLLPEQRDDVAKLEKRLIEENKNGMLFTNSTGTGKSFTGLGAVKRFANAGKKNILIVSMNDKIIRDFIKSAKSLNLDIHQLDGITDNGKDKIVATTYANMAQNNTLGMRDWDLIIVDEAHNLMQGEKGEDTNALAKLRALSGHHAGFNEWVKMRHADKDPKPIGESPETGLPIYNQDEVAAWEAFKKPLREQWKKTWSEQPKGRTKVIFLTATPFSYVKTLDWAEGYLFDFVPPADKFSNKTDAMGSAYNSGSEYERFYMSNFGYKMRTNRLTRPDSRVDVGILERKFAEKLKGEGAMSGRDLSVPFDYDRKFVLVNSEIGKEIDEGFSYLWDTKDKDGKSKYSELLRVLNKRFDYLARLQLLEAIKAQEAIEQIKKHIALGRKVIVFHDYNEGGGSNPFVYVGGATQNDVGAVESQYADFKKARPDLIALDLDLDAPITTIKKAFPDALLYNGRVAKGQRSKNADLFNTDSNGHNVLIAQSDAAATGISFHDTTGAHQRVIINIGMPSKPAKLRQTEGRIYRVGQASNAIQRYLTTGTDWERSAFAQKIAERAETVDNLAQGESAVVSIKDALVQAYEEAEYFEPSENDGIGGKAYDEENARINKLTPFERAKTDYWVKQKVTAKRQDREGKEWYATPEPVGLFMVNLSGAHSGDDILEPSAGDGAIGRYMPSDASVTFIEPSESLASRARMNNTNANVIVDGFESHGTNNKYDSIVMNPPFGQGGSIAIKHLVKAFEHLRDGGRVVALLPVGNMDELIVKYSQMGYFKDIYTVAEFTLPSSTFKNAGTAVNTKIHVFERHNFKGDAPQGVISKNLSHYDDIEDLFDAIENISIKPRKPRIDEALAEYGIEIYPNRSKYIITGEGIKRRDITSTIFGSYIEKNKDGDVVEKYNRSTAFLKWLKDSQIPNMAQFNNGLSFNNLPIKYQSKTNQYDTWDGLGSMPDWLRLAMILFKAESEYFAVEKPVYDAVDDNKPQAILSAMRQALNTPSDENIQALAREAGLRIKKGSVADLTAKDMRIAVSFNDARAQAKAFQGQVLHNSFFNLDASVSRANLDKMLSAKAVSKSVSPKVQALAVANVDKLFALANKKESHDDRDNDVNIKQVHRLYSSMEFEGRILQVKITVKELQRADQTNRIYSVEAVEIDAPTGLVAPSKDGIEWADSTVLDVPNPTSTPQVGASENIAQPQNSASQEDSIIKIEFPVKQTVEAWQHSIRNASGIARSFRETYKDYIKRAYNLALPLAETDAQKQALEKASLELQREYIQKIAVLNSSRSGVTSSFIAGRNNFNKSQADRRGSAFDKVMEDFDKWTTSREGSLKIAVMLARNVEQKAAEQAKNAELQAEKDAKIKAKQDKDDAFLERLLAFRKGDDFKVGSSNLVRVNKNKDGLPTTITVSAGNGIIKGMNDKIELVGSRMTYKTLDDLKQAIERIKRKNNRLDDIGSFNFTPAVDFDTTLKAMKTALTDGSESNIKRLATLAGLTLKEPEPDIEFDMFGEPINQDFDLFGEPIQDGDESPVEELPRLAVVELPLNKLTLSDDVPQFKSGVEDSETGVVEALGGKFDRTGVAPIQVWERLDGRLEIISGRHRTDLARRSGEKTIPAQVHKESEGFTAKQAMMLDAELNIRDGQGKVKDYVDYFTHSEISEDEAERRGLIARSIGQRAFVIASKGSEELITLHRNEIISDQAAAEIASIAPKNSAMQAVGLRVLQEHKPLNNALNTIRAVQALTREKGQEPDTFDLFGFDDSALKEAEAMARIASRKQRQIAEQLNAIKGAVKNPKLAAKHGVVVENEADALAKVKTMTAQKARWDNWSSYADLLAEVRSELNTKLDSLDDEDDYYWFCQEELVA